MMCVVELTTQLLFYWIASTVSDSSGLKATNESFNSKPQTAAFKFTSSRLQWPLLPIAIELVVYIEASGDCQSQDLCLVTDNHLLVIAQKHTCKTVQRWIICNGFQSNLVRRRPIASH